MLDFFTDPFKDELIYSTIARYHFYSGNVDYRDTIEECFGKRTMIPTLEIGGNFEHLSKVLGKKYSSEILMTKHTILPYYLPFISEKIKKEIINEIKYKGNYSIYTKLGIVAGGICRKESIFYCPMCARKDIDEHGEPYIHREHQLEGIVLCPHHGILLEKYPLKKIDVSRLEYIRFEEKYLKLKAENTGIMDYEKHLRLAKASYYLLNNNLSEVCKEKILKRYRYFLYKKDLLKGNNTINQRKLYEELVNDYGSAFLKELDSEVDFFNEYNWLKVISRKSRRISHPLRHLLFINFLCKDMKGFFDNIDSSRINDIKKRSEKYNIENANLNKMKIYKEKILNIITYSGLSRTDIRNKCKKEYMYLYRYNKEWLLKQLPIKVTVNSDNRRIDWKQRDEQYLKLLKEKYEELINDEIMIKITRSSLAKPLGILVNIEKKLDQLPLTKKFFEEVCESTKEFQLRRAKSAIDKKIDANVENIRLWEVQRIAAIRSEHFKDIKEDLQKYLDER